jgi:hypothetical protein
MNVHIPVNKLIFALIIGGLYALVASPQLYKIVGSLIGKEEYDNPNRSDRYYLLAIHSFVMFLVCFLLLLVYTPFTIHQRVVNRITK